MRIEIEIKDETNRTSVKQVIDTTGGPKYGLEFRFNESERESGKFKLTWDAGYQCQVSILMNSKEVKELKESLNNGCDCT